MVQLRLKVAEAPMRDVGRVRARMDREVMRRIGVSIGDIVELVGNRSTAAVVWPAYPEDGGQAIVKIDGVVRQNAGAEVGGYVVVRRAEVRDAEGIRAGPTTRELRVDPDCQWFVREALMNRPIVEGDIAMIHVLFWVPFEIVETTPKGIVRVVPETEVVIRSRPSRAPTNCPLCGYRLTRQYGHYRCDQCDLFF
ncbi:MAG: hypothetical protein ACE5OY_05950 [Candidatus Bathyarchaeia archaeon]